MLNNVFFPKRTRSLYVVRCLQIRGGHRWQYVACALRAGYVSLQIHTKKCNIYCFSTVTMVAKSAPQCYIYVHCLSCCVFLLFCVGTCWFLKTGSKACLLRDLETNKMQDVSLHWPGHALKRKNDMWNNSIEINENKFKMCGFRFLRSSLEPVGRDW